MFQKIRTFWNAFWNAIKTAYNKAFRELPKDNTQHYRDIKKINLLAIFVSKLNNLASIESTYDVVSDSIQADELKELCKDLEAKRFDITSEFLGTGDYWVFPSHTNSGKLFHRYITQDRVRILDMDGENITDLIGIIDEYVDNNNRIYLLNRRHTLNGDTLKVETYVTNERNERVFLDEWADIDGVAYSFGGAKHIGVGRFKSPTSSRGTSIVYGVPLNYGCEEIEAKIFNDLAMIEDEFKNGKSVIFTDPRNLLKRDDKLGYEIAENIIPITQRAGQSGSNIDIFSPALRYEGAFKNKLLDDMTQYEQQVGTDRGFLTPFESGGAATATEIRRANASTIALIDKIHTAIKNGIKMTLAADAVFLNVSEDLYSLKFDFYDAFEDADKQYERLASAVDRGVAEKADEMQWLFPNLTIEEREEKLARISAESQVSSDAALEKILQGQ